MERAPSRQARCRRQHVRAKGQIRFKSCVRRVADREMLIPATSALPRLCTAGFSIISFNVLLPNSQDGWWLYKYYDGNTKPATTQWPARSALLAERLLSADADVVLLQECSADSFDTDWSFLTSAGYECAMHTKGRMRPATFWKRDRMALCDAGGELIDADQADGGGLIHGDRTLTTMLRLRGEDGMAVRGREPLFVVNCHLSAGSEARRRLRQVHDALDAIRKARAKSAADAAKSPAVLCAGDFNSQGRSGVRELLEVGEVLSTFRESGDPTEHNQHANEVTSKPKRHGFGVFADAMEQAHGARPTPGGPAVPDNLTARYDAWRAISGRKEVAPFDPFAKALSGGAAAGGGAPPPTIIAAELMSSMVDAKGEPSAALVRALDESFDGLSADGLTLSEDEQTAWLIAINKQLGRGSEYRAAKAAREARDGALLTRADFQAIYKAELEAGKYWGVEHDLRVMRGGQGMRTPGSAPFTARFDAIYFSTDTLRLNAAQEALPAEKLEALLAGRDILPNEWHASDHLPVAASLEFID